MKNIHQGMVGKAVVGAGHARDHSMSRAWPAPTAAVCRSGFIPTHFLCRVETRPTFRPERTA